MSERKEAVFVFFASENGRDGWRLVKPEDVPAWVKEPEVLGQLAIGNVAQNCTRPDELIYRADVHMNVWDRERLTKAIETRDTRDAQELLVLPESVDRQLVVETSELKH